MPRKRITSRELTEVRTVLSRARTARDSINAWANLSSSERFAYNKPVHHSDHELAMMRSALGTAIYVLEQTEQLVGYRDDDGSGGGGHDTGGNSPSAPSSPEPGPTGQVRGAGGDSGDHHRPVATSGLYGGI